LGELGERHTGLGLGEDLYDSLLHFLKLGLALDQNLLVFERVLLDFMLVNLRRPDDLSLEVAQDVLLDRQLHHLCCLADRAALDGLRAAYFQKLGAAVATPRDHAQLRALRAKVVTKGY